MVQLPGQSFCHACGKPIDPRAEICPGCGVRQKNPIRVASGGRSRTTAIILALFLGGVGGHKFYLGQSGMGVAYLLFCWTFIPVVIALVEMIILISMNDDAFNAKYN